MSPRSSRAGSPAPIRSSCEPYRDGDGRLYTPMIREPIFVYTATSAELTRTHGRAVSRDMRFAIYTEPLFKTANDADKCASVAATPTPCSILSGSDYTPSERLSTRSQPD
jgi:hypothetical protein